MTAIEVITPKEAAATDIGEWASVLREANAQSFAAIVQHGRLLIEAKEAVGHGNWYALIAQLPYTDRHAERLMAIARHPLLANPTCMSDLVDALPPHVSTLYELSRVEAPDLELLVAERKIEPEMTCGQVKKLIRSVEAEKTRAACAEGAAKMAANGRDVIDLYGDEPLNAGKEREISQRDREDLQQKTERAIRDVAGVLDGMFPPVTCGFEAPVSRIIAFLARGVGETVDAVMDKRIPADSAVVREDVRTLLVGLIYSEFGADAGLPQPRIAKPFAMESSNVSRMKDAVADWEEYEPMQTVLDGLRLVAQGLAAHDRLSGGRGASGPANA